MKRAAKTPDFLNVFVLQLEFDAAIANAPSARLAWKFWIFVALDQFGQAQVEEPTNNASERALRHPVIWRKLSFGTQSAAGSRFVETMLTVVETCRQQSRKASAFITSAVEASFAHQSAPSLLAGL